MTEFWTRHKLLEHLQDKAPKCLAYLRLSADRLTDEQVAVLDGYAAEQAKSNRIATSRRAAAVRLATRLLGPLPAVPCEEEPGGCHHPLGVGRRWLN